MRTLATAIFLVVASALLITAGTSAQDKKKEEKQVTLKGKIACNKCELGKSDQCETVIVVKDDKKKDVVFFFDAASHKKFHDDICASAKNGTVEGVVKDVEKKKVISVKKVTYD